MEAFSIHELEVQGTSLLYPWLPSRPVAGYTEPSITIQWSMVALNEDRRDRVEDQPHPVNGEAHVVFLSWNSAGL